MHGDVMEACNCEITCPGNFGGPPTELPCEPVLGVRIREGNYGTTNLDNLNFVPYVRIPGKLFDGGWTLGAYLDQRANEAQMSALGTILYGQAGGWFAAVSGLIATALPAKQVSISFEIEDGEDRIIVPGLLEVGAERIPNAMPGEPALDAKVDGLTVPFYNVGPASVRRSSMFSLTDPGMSFEYPGLSAPSGRFDYTGP